MPECKWKPFVLAWKETVAGGEYVEKDERRRESKYVGREKERERDEETFSVYEVEDSE